MSRLTNNDLMHNAWQAGLAIPSFNIPHLPMMEPVVQALRDTESFGLITVARPEWIKFEAKSPKAIYEEYQRTKDERYTRLHLDHVPVIDEDNLPVDYLSIIREALDLGYESVMVDGSRLSLDDNIAATTAVVTMAHAAGIPVEAELGAVLGHEAGPLPPYEEIFASGKGFTDPADARRFAEETAVDWLSVAIGNIHGPLAAAARSSKKVEARLNIQHLDTIRREANLPLVLHGGSGINKACILESFRHGIAKINVGTTIRQAYESAWDQSIAAAQQACYHCMVELLTNELELAGKAIIINPQEATV